MENGISISNIPTPDQVPEAVDLSHLPAQLLRSTAIESLVSQNEDLMARLSVSLRRLSLLEDQIKQHDELAVEFKLQHESLKDQVAIYKEKSRRVSEKWQSYEENLKTLQLNLEASEIRYAELYSQAQKKSEAYALQIQNLEKRIFRFERFHRRLQSAKLSLKSQLHSSRSEKIRLEKNLIAIELDYSEVKSKLGDSASYIQKQSHEFQKNQAALIEQHETQVKTLQQALQTCEEKYASAEDRLESYNRLYEENVELQNKLVFIERRHGEAIESLEKSLAATQQTLSHYRSENSTKVAQLSSLQQELAEIKTENQETAKENSALQEQVENLQTMWRQNQIELERQNEKNKSLQKLNQQLSLSLNDYRKKVQDSENQLDSFKMQSEEKLKQLKLQFQLSHNLAFVEEQKSKTALEINKPVVAGFNSNTDSQNDLNQKIDKLLIEIQSGFSKSPEL